MNFSHQNWSTVFLDGSTGDNTLNLALLSPTCHHSHYLIFEREANIYSSDLEGTKPLLENPLAQQNIGEVFGAPNLFERKVCVSVCVQL